MAGELLPYNWGLGPVSEKGRLPPSVELAHPHVEREPGALPDGA
eukprot:CAMPEP_0182576000 /NCGR_PEP_ID=MMETSP1324-20130603/32237_1 /TAXON_ID=236786 /ORGANISM="Florenciella sp., Strain RCC1587" /LENGTH=43 /DNA_ID= /DNA_START= /DNA_END= /DNA_ORIENTATION=